MSFIRKGPVNLAEYLPGFLSKSPEYKAGLDTESEEHERMRLKLLDIAKQFNVNTADWGLERWEDLLGIEYVGNRSIEFRRTIILARLGNAESVTGAFLTKLINEYIPGKTGKVESHPETYSVNFIIPHISKNDFLEMVKSVNIYIPAHLGREYKAKTIVNDGAFKIYFGMRKKLKRTVRVYAADGVVETVENNLYIAIATIEEETLEMGG